LNSQYAISGKLWLKQDRVIEFSLQVTSISSSSWQLTNRHHNNCLKQTKQQPYSGNILRTDDRQPGPLVTVLTPQGRGAIAVVQVWGRGAIALADSVFRPARGPGLNRASTGQLRLGRIGRGFGDEVVAVVTADNPPCVEIQCHGGSAALSLVVDELLEREARLVETDVWAKHAGGSPIQAAAILEMTRAPTLRTAEILLEQTQGALDLELGRLLEEIRAKNPGALERLDRLISNGHVGVRLTSGWRVVIAGRPNVGKSRLLNALAGYTRAIVDATPGTTRDPVTALTAFDGWPVELVDTAGMRETDDAIEHAGIDRALQQTRTADLILLLLDRSQPLQGQKHALFRQSAPSLLVATKADLGAAWEPSDLAQRGKPPCVVSAVRGDGLDELIATAVTALVPIAPDPAAGVPFEQAQVDLLKQACVGLKAGDYRHAMQCIESVLEDDRLELN
jgi:tRNA modification GTPase